MLHYELEKVEITVISLLRITGWGSQLYMIFARFYGGKDNKRHNIAQKLFSNFLVISIYNKEWYEEHYFQDIQRENWNASVIKQALKAGFYDVD